MSDAELFWRVEPVDRENSEHFKERAIAIGVLGYFNVGHPGLRHT
jgi:hypothetical protein